MQAPFFLETVNKRARIVWHKTMYVYVHVTPKSSRDEVVGFEQGAQQEVLKVRVSAAPTDGKANKAVCHLIASQLRIPKSCVSVTNGTTSRYKRVSIDADEQRVASWLERFR